MKQPVDDAALAAKLATQAGDLLIALRASGRFAGPALGAEGDRIANDFLCAALRHDRPADAILSEEEADCADRLAASRVWIIDPLDGTREFAEGRDDWAVHVALAVDGVAMHGAVALPALGVTLASHQVTLAPARPGPPRIVVSRSRPPELAARVATALNAKTLAMGSAGAKAMAVVRGEAEIYLHAGGQHEWDNAAPVAVAQAAGLHCSRIDGSPIRYNNADTLVPDLLICRPEWRDRVLHVLNAE